MLSFIYRLVRDYESSHGYRPNLLVINPRHYQNLRQSVPVLSAPVELTRFLGMRVLLDGECTHPHVSWSAIAERELA
jgi:hypothetical protein